ncbi:MAG: chemotaxis protein CheA [Candidatus Omnitrophica bacterium]|nr:chemotaxis protein CheA [Candidatus Omnitrophota bacterium]
MSEGQNEFLSEFLDESEEHLAVLNDKMLEAESSIKQGTDMSDDDLNAMFRAAHTIKGTASFIGLNKVINLMHKTETLLQHLRNREINLTGEIVDVLFSSFDSLTSLLTSLRESGEEAGEIENDVAKIEMILNQCLGRAQDAAKERKVAEPQAAESQESEEKSSEPQAVEAPAPTGQAQDVLIEEPGAEGVAPEQEDEPRDVEPKINNKYLQQFLDELDQNIADFERCLLSLEEQNDDKEMINNIFRHMHTIKGSSGVINAQKITNVSHKMENVLSYLRDREGKVDPGLIALLFKGLDVIGSLSEALKTVGHLSGVDITKVCQELDDCHAVLIGAEDQNVSIASGADGEVIFDEEVTAFFEGHQLSEMEHERYQEAFKQQSNIYNVKISFDDSVILRSMKAMIVEERLKKSGVLIGTRPLLEALDETDMKVYCGFTVATNKKHNELETLLSLAGVQIIFSQTVDIEKVKGIIVKAEQASRPQNKVNVEEGVSRSVESRKGASMKNPVEEKLMAASKSVPSDISTIRIDSRKLDNLMNLSGELVIIRAQFARLVNLFNNDVANQKETVRIMENIELYFDTIKKEINDINGSAKENEVDDKGVSRIHKVITEMMTIFGDLNKMVLNNDIIENIHALDETTSMLEKISSNIQSGVMQTRMIPIEGVFTRFKRIVRDISKEINKEVDLKIEGQETELDKKIVDGLGDPLTHMIRNSVDHGIEDNQTRQDLGKTRVGSVYLKASHKGNNICIEVGDDGKGIDCEKLVEKALDKGLITAEQVDRMSEKDKLNLVFMPGFSTAEQVTGLSGRGVGMDVVKNMINSVNGVVDIETKLGEGTNFMLKIPLTLAIIQALLVTIGSEIYAFPLETVTEIIKVSKEDIYSVDRNDTVKIRDHALSLIELEKVIKIKRKEEKSQDEEKKKKRSRKVVIITDGESRLGVVVDELVGKEEIVIKSFTEHFSRVKGLTGASILADGTVALILDSATIIRESR